MKRIASAATTNSTLVKAGPTLVHGLILSNDAAAKKYVKLYNKVSAPTVGTDTPVLTIMLPAGSTTVFEFPEDTTFSLGLGFGITGAIADNDTTATAANDVHGAIFYK